MSERWQINFYYEPDGTAPVQEFLKNACLTQAELKQLEVCIKLLAAYGLLLRAYILNQIETQDNLYELRLDAPSNNLRILLCALTGRRLFLLHSFKNKSQRTQQSEIKTAARRRDRLLVEEESNK